MFLYEIVENMVVVSAFILLSQVRQTPGATTRKYRNRLVHLSCC